MVRVPLHITRDAVLSYAGVQHYCRSQQHRCLVQVNGIGRPILRPGPRTMRHGMYLRVIVPPPLEGTNTLHAIHVAEAPAQVNALLPNALGETRRLPLHQLLLQSH